MNENMEMQEMNQEVTQETTQAAVVPVQQQDYVMPAQPQQKRGLSTAEKTLGGIIIGALMTIGYVIGSLIKKGIDKFKERKAAKAAAQTAPAAPAQQPVQTPVTPEQPAQTQTQAAPEQK